MQTIILRSYHVYFVCSVSVPPLWLSIHFIRHRPTSARLSNQPILCQLHNIKHTNTGEDFPANIRLRKKCHLCDVNRGMMMIPHEWTLYNWICFLAYKISCFCKICSLRVTFDEADRTFWFLCFLDVALVSFSLFALQYWSYPVSSRASFYYAYVKYP